MWRLETEEQETDPKGRNPKDTIEQEDFVEILQGILSNFYRSEGMGSTKSKVQMNKLGVAKHTPHPTPATPKMMQTRVAVLSCHGSPSTEAPIESAESNDEIAARLGLE